MPETLNCHIKRNSIPLHTDEAVVLTTCGFNGDNGAGCGTLGDWGHWEPAWLGNQFARLFGHILVVPFVFEVDKLVEYGWHTNRLRKNLGVSLPRVRTPPLGYDRSHPWL